MKFLLIILLLTTSFFTNAKSVWRRDFLALEEKVKVLEKKVADLEKTILAMRKAASNQKDKTTGLRVKDYQGTTKAVGVSRGVASPGPSLTKEQTQQIQNTIEQYKKNKAESDKILDQIMNEDF